MTSIHQFALDSSGSRRWRRNIRIAGRHGGGDIRARERVFHSPRLNLSTRMRGFVPWTGFHFDVRATGQNTLLEQTPALARSPDYWPQVHELSLPFSPSSSLSSSFSRRLVSLFLALIGSFCRYRIGPHDILLYGTIARSNS